MGEPLSKALKAGLETLDLSGSAGLIEQYLALLKHWSKAYNLVAKCDDQMLLARHVFDSLSVRPFIRGPRCLDVGTGAGLPGLLLAVTMPDLEWILLDANGKKTRFCEQAVYELGLKNVTVIQQRIENHRPERLYDTVVSRAYGQAADLVEVGRHLINKGGQILAMKGRISTQEKAASEAKGLCLEIQPLDVPGLKRQRHVMVFQ